MDYSAYMVRVRNTLPKLDDALAKRNWDEARRLAHGIGYDIGNVLAAIEEAE